MWIDNSIHLCIYTSSALCVCVFFVFFITLGLLDVILNIFYCFFLLENVYIIRLSTFYTKINRFMHHIWRSRFWTNQINKYSRQLKSTRNTQTHTHEPKCDSEFSTIPNEFEFFLFLWIFFSSFLFDKYVHDGYSQRLNIMLAMICFYYHCKCVCVPLMNRSAKLLLLAFSECSKAFVRFNASDFAANKIRRKKTRILCVRNNFTHVMNNICFIRWYSWSFTQITHLDFVCKFYSIFFCFFRSKKSTHTYKRNDTQIHMQFLWKKVLAVSMEVETARLEKKCDFPRNHWTCFLKHENTEIFAINKMIYSLRSTDRYMILSIF